MITRSERVGSHEPILVVSNRGPYEHEFAPDGSLRAVPGQGGVATALRVAAEYRRTVWLASPLTAADRFIAAGLASSPGCDATRRYVSLPDAAYRLFYECFSNEVLWFLQHEMPWRVGLSSDERMEAWHDGYQVANERFADAVARAAEATGAGSVMIHDYHFYTLAALVRARKPGLYLQQFVHIPWPDPAVWSRLEAEVVAAICEGLLGNDAVFFQTPDAAASFVATCRAFLDGAVVDRGGVNYRGRRTRVAAQPISIDADELRGLVASWRFPAYQSHLSARDGEQLIVRVDRLDPSKNVYAGFLAFERLLIEHPELQRQVRFLAFLVPTRGDVAAYRDYQQRTLALVERINANYGSDGWQPITVMFENNRLQALAGLSLADVTLINPLADGMNLVAKEAALVNQKDGALVLSTRAGAYRELGDAALPIEPRDVAATAQALYRGLTMTVAERRDRARRLRAQVVAHDLRMWFSGLLADLDNAASGGPGVQVAAAVFADSRRPAA